MDKQKIVQYIPNGMPIDIKDCIDTKKTSKLLEHIQNAKITDDEKTFLTLAAYRHLAFNYSSIAEYYASASKEMQKLMEESALVIVDIDDALQNGFLKLYEKLEDIEE